MSIAAVSFVRLGSNERDGRARYALLLSAVLTFSVYRASLVGLDRLGELWLGSAFDISVWSLCWLVSEAVAGKRIVWRERAASVLFYPLFYASAALVFAHTWFYEAAIERRLTALDISLAGIGVFFREALPLRGYLVLLALLFSLHGLALVFSNKLQRPRFWPAFTATVAMSLLSFLGSALAQRTPSVLFDTGKELWELCTLPRVVPAPVARLAQRKAALDKSAVAALPVPRFKKVIVLVMETMPTEKLERELSVLPAHNFFRAQSPHLHAYTRYFPNNQDSRTGMLDMLMSRVIPYEAYSDADAESYAPIARQESLVDRARLLGFRTAFAVSQVELEVVVRDLRWDELLHLAPEEIPGLRKKYLCIQPDEWENGCEDRALLPRVVDFVANNERAFVYQEFIWGHASDYNVASGKTNTTYYAGYIDALIAALSARGVLAETLIAITSDHGFRDKSKQAELGVYRIPLFFYAERFSARRDARLLSHVDFKDLLFDELSESTAFSTPNERVLIVGPTASGMLTAVSDDGGFVLMRRRYDQQLLVAHRPKGSARELSPDQILHLFERYRADFDRTLRDH